MVATEGIKVAAEAAMIDDELSPRAILRTRMRELWHRGDEESKDKAVIIARDLAPYEHHRLAALDMSAQITQSSKAQELTDDQLAAIAAGSSTDAADEAEGAGKPH
jgi:hypothetical protein